MTAELGQIIDGKYRIVRLLGTGGMGAVFEGENIRIRRRVAIKMLHGSVSTQPEVIARFEREAQAAALVGSDHICEVLDLGTLADETRYMVMEYLEGETLSSLIQRHGRLQPAQSIPILAQILDALGAAHAAGIIHRDLKPDNVFILPHKGGVQSFVKILDFGVSKFSQLGGEAMNVTRAGAVVGTPYYMSPEQARGSSAIDQRTDIYAIGVLLYQATTGQVPYQAETFNELLFKIVLEVAPPPQAYVPDLDPEFAAIIMRAMAREPDQRFQSCQQFRAALVDFQVSRQVPRANAPPALAPPSFHHDPSPFRTEVLDLSKLPGNALSPINGTLPMQPGLPFGSNMAGNTGPGSTPSPLQSGASWALGSSPSSSGVAASTANSWGNASSPANAPIKPRSNRLLVGVVAAVAVAGIGAGVAAFVMLGKSPPVTSKTMASQPTATVTATAEATPSRAVAPTASADAQATPTVEPSSTPSASASATTGATGATSARSASSGRLPGPMPTGAATVKASTATNKGSKPVPKSGGNDLGY